MEEILDDILEDSEQKINEWTLFVGSSAEYYVCRWEDIEQGSKYSFNAGAFFLGVIWMLYRKMYIEQAIFVVLLIVETTLESFILEKMQVSIAQKILDIGSTLVIYGLLGFAANWLYYQHSKRKIEKIRQRSMDKASFESALRETGGTSFLSVVIGAIIYIAIFAGFMAAFG